MKRFNEESSGRPQPHKKHKHDHLHRKHQHSNGHSSFHKDRFSGRNEDSHRDAKKSDLSHTDAISQLPPVDSKSGPIPAYSAFTVSAVLPSLPPIDSDTFSTVLWTHKSKTTYNRTASSKPDITYEKLEFIGDAYIELIASRLIFERFMHLPAGQMSQLRELLVKNETLAEYSRAYGFEEKVQAGNMDILNEQSKYKGNKGFNKVLGDVFEAYVAAVVLSDVEDGFAVAEKWLTALWAPKLVEAARKDRSYAYTPNLALTPDVKTADPLSVYNPTAKQDLQKRIGGPGIKLSYETWKDTVELKGDQLGQNRHFIALYLTGYGYDRKLLGQGEGKNKVEAGNWAATEAMHGECKSIVDECERKLLARREERDRAKQAAEHS